ncbi:MAG: hypothetical protein HY695_17655 [Deltaproteobacteria bacterium]|nr:hypothetical protein [Deltaproteobacteria bacterium]
MVKKHLFCQYPERVSTGPALPISVYVCLPGYYAVHNRPAAAPASGAIFLLNDGAIAVFQGEPDTESSSAAGSLSPVYRLHPGGPLAVPTGLVLVRFAAGVVAETRREQLAQAGYENVESLVYAPQAVWTRARSGDIAAALNGIPALQALADIENVEPQMLMQRVRRKMA